MHQHFSRKCIQTCNLREAGYK